MSSLRLYRHPLSGNSHRVELFLSILGLEVEMINVDLLQGEQKQPKFLKKNVFGQVPVLEDGAVTIAESTAILVYLASQYDEEHTWLPIEPAKAAEVQRFLAVASGPLASGPATARLINLLNLNMDKVSVLESSNRLLLTLDRLLAQRMWLTGAFPTIADIANYSYIALAPEGDISLQSYSHLRAWLQAVEQLPGFVPMQRSAIGLAA